jgi:hypothetical protein
MKDLLTDVFKRVGIKIDNKAVIADGFATFQGVLAGIALNDIWRMLNLPGNNTPISINGIPSTNFSVDYLYQVTIAGLIAASQVLFKVDHGLAFGAGMFTGATWANTAEQGGYIGFAQTQPKTPPPAPMPGAPAPIASSLTFQGPYGQGSGVWNTPVTSAPAPPYNPMLVPQLNRPTLT